MTTSDTAPPATNGDGLNGFNEQALDLEFVEQPPPPAVVEDGFEKPVLNGGTNHAQLDVQQDEALAAPPVANTLSALPLAQQNAMRRVATPTPPPTREEPAKIRTWREQQKERLEKKGRDSLAISLKLMRISLLSHCERQLVFGSVRSPIAVSSVLDHIRLHYRCE